MEMALSNAERRPGPARTGTVYHLVIEGSCKSPYLLLAPHFPVEISDVRDNPGRHVRF